jgi:hypothetical protein
MPYSGKRRFPYRLTIYVPPEKERIVKDFIETFRARNESASQKILSFIENYDDLIIFDREELRHILLLFREDREEALRILSKKISETGKVNPQTRLSRYDSEEAKPAPKPTLCAFGSACNKPAVAIAVHEESSRYYPICEYHRRMLDQEPEWKILTQGGTPGGLGHAPSSRKAKSQEE